MECKELVVRSRHGWNKCCRTAKKVVISQSQPPRFLCGIHARHYRLKDGEKIIDAKEINTNEYRIKT